MKRVRNAWMFFDKDGNWICGEEDKLLRRYGSMGWGSGSDRFGRMLQASAGNKSFDLSMDLSGVRMERVVRLKRSIATNSYRVSAADLADRLIASVTGS